MKKKGFTLIELLAVIVILSIIAVIATPIILGIVENVRKDAFQRSVELLLKSTDIDLVNKMMGKNESTPISKYEVVNIAPSAFKEKRITSIELPSSVEYIGEGAFAFNQISGELDLSYLSKLSTINLSAFLGSEDGSTNQIASLKLPASLTSIGKDAFRYNALTSVTFVGRSDLKGVSVGSNAWGWASGSSNSNIYYE